MTDIHWEPVQYCCSVIPREMRERHTDLQAWAVYIISVSNNQWVVQDTPSLSPARLIDSNGQRRFISGIERGDPEFYFIEEKAREIAERFCRIMRVAGWDAQYAMQKAREWDS